MSRSAEQIFHDARGMSAAERDEYLARVCGEDGALRAEVEALLKADAEAGEFLRTSEEAPLAAGATAGSTPREHEGQLIGRYKLLQPIGEGGFGSVWMAEQREPVKRRVALKIIKLGMDTRQVIARFEAERQALAMMDHPNIAKVLDAGATETGRLYFVMEYIKGVPILEYCDTGKLDTRARLGLFASVCHAIQHAHQKGIIHRDIKPSNVLVTMHDGVAVPKVIDFGIAKATSSELTQRTLFTEHRQLIGTPAYMSPEQAEMSGLDIDTRSDIYSLGVLLYELLTGTTPFDSKSLMEAGFAEMMRIIREVEPHKPSTRLSSLGDTPPGARTAQQRQAGDIRKLGLILRGDLDWIVMKCLEKDRARRYETANGLAADIKRHLNDETVTAGAPSAGYRLRKFVRRNRVRVIAGGVVAGALVLGVVGTTSGMIWALNERDRANAASTRAVLAAESEAKAKVQAQENEKKAIAEAKRAEATSKFVTTALRAGDAETAGYVAGTAGAGQDMTILAAMDYAIKDIDSGRFKDDPETEASLRDTIGMILMNNGRLARSEPLFRDAMEKRRRVLGSEHPDTLTSNSNMGGLLQAQGRPAEAEPYLREALEGRRRVLGNEHPQTLTSISNMASLLQAQGKLTEAEPYAREALDGRRRVLGDEHAETLSSICNMGTLLQEQGRSAEAEPYTREALANFRRVLGEEHPDTLTAINNMGNLLRAQGKLAEAEPYFREALERRRRVLGDEHPSTVMSISNLGVLLRDRGKLTEAEPYYREALERRRHLLGDEHPDTLGSILNMGSLLRTHGKLAEAEPYLREAMEKLRRVLGDEHPDTLISINNMGNLLRQRGKLPEAEQYAREALERCRRVLGDEHPSTLTSINNMGLLLQAQGRLPEAEAYLRETLETRRRVAGDEHHDTLNTINNLGFLLQSQGRAEAEPLFCEVLETRRRVLGDEHLDTLTSIHNIGNLLQTLGKLNEAEPYYRDVLEKRRRVLGDGHPNTLTSIITLGILLQEQGRLTEAESCFREALETRQRLFKGDHPEVANSLHYAGSVRQAMGRAAEAEALLVQALGMRQRLFKGDRSDVATNLSALAHTREALGKTAEARQGFDQAIAMLRRLSRDGSALLARVLWRSGSARFENKGGADAAAALTELEEAVAMAEKFLPPGPPEHPHLREYRETLAKCRAALAEQGKPDAKGGGG
jgi:eukaryotic-like serine/threonine-protein kinase